jgi:protein O-mannosyl-transferase
VPKQPRLIYRLSIFSFITLVSLLVYYPGLQGSFLFDDFANLDKLGEFNGVRNLDTFLKFVGNGIAGPTGRPLSLLSFLLNGTNWPTDPYPFKLTNVALHGLSGFFLFLLCQLLCTNFKLNPQQTFVASLIAASFWLLHPFFVSTVLYVVQRMAMLSAFFSIVGLWLFCKGRLLLIDNTLQSQNRKAYLYMSLSLGLCTVLAILSKENGVLLPLLAACIELCVFSHPNSIAKPINRYWSWTFLVFPSIVIVAYLIHDINPYNFIHPFGARNFNLPERLMTESRVVTGYLYHLIIPKMFYPGILNENISISKSLWNPPQTAVCVLFIFTLVAVALGSRKRFPFFALAVLFFFAGHLLESTTLPLELYFEHRNYLPAIFLFMPVGYFFVTQQNRLVKGIIIFILAICPVFTYQLSKLWGNELALTLFWAKQNPTSSRAQRTAALSLENNSNHLAALQLLTQAKINIPNSLDLQWHWLRLKCNVGGVTVEEFSDIKRVSSALPFTPYYFNMLKATVETIINKQCTGLTSTNALELLDILLTNPGILSDHGLLFQPHHLKGLVFTTTNKPKEALVEYDTVLRLTQNVEHGLVQVSFLASHGYFSEALTHLNDVEKILASQPKTSQTVFKTKLDYQAEIARLKQNLLDDIKSRSK